MHRSFPVLLLVTLLAPLLAGAAATEDDFYIKSAQDLVDVCSTPEDSPLNDAADHFCHGFLVGAWQYHQAQANGPKGVRLVCPPDPPPTRDQAIAGFLTWSSANTQYLSEPAVESLFRYLITTYPCKEGSK
jgi:hypothetical protein